MSRHAARVEGLAPQETITIALRLSGKSRTWLHDGGEGTIGRLLGEPEMKERLTAEAEPATPSGPGTYAFMLSAGSEVREQNLVLRIALADLTSASDGNIERLRQRALINRY